MRISDWSSDVCSSDLFALMPRGGDQEQNRITSPPCLVERILPDGPARSRQRDRAASRHPYDRSSARTKTVMSMTMHEDDDLARSEEHTSELQSLMRISYAVFCLKKKTNNNNTPRPYIHNKHNTKPKHCTHDTN